MLNKSNNKEIKKSLDIQEEKELRILSMIICTMVEDENYIEGEEKVREAMCLYPHSPIPHNLMGILLVKKKSSSSIKAFSSSLCIRSNLLTC